MDFTAWTRACKNILGSRWFRLLFSATLVVGLCVKLHVTQRVSKASPDVQWMLAAQGIAITIALISVRAWRWNVILGDLNRSLPTIELARIYGSTFFLGLVSPMKIGEVARIWLVREQTKSLPVAAFSVAFDRVFDLLPTLLITAAFGTFVGVSDKSLLVDGIRVAFVLIALILVVLLISPKLFQAWIQLLAWKLLARLGHADGAESTREETTRIHRRTVVKAFAFSLASQGLLLLQTHLFAQAVGANINPLAAYAVVTMSSVVASLPLSIGGVGTREVAVVWALTSIGLGMEQAIAFSLIGLLNFVTTLGLSMIAFVSQPLHIAEHLARFRSPPTSGAS